jgi:hypothetical protein
MPIAQGQVGIQLNSDGASPVQGFRQGKQGEMMVSELHGRFYEQAYRNALFGNGTTALTALTANTVTLTATTTPIIGVYNPSTSNVNLVILQAALASGINNAASTGPGAFVWAASIGNSAITTGSQPVNHRTLTLQGSLAKGMSFVALTGLTNNLVVLKSADFPTPTIVTTAAVSTAIQTPTVQSIQNIDGAFIVPPGGVLALLNTVSTTTVSVTGRMMWEEVPV